MKEPSGGKNLKCKGGDLDTVLRHWGPSLKVPGGEKREEHREKEQERRMAQCQE